MYLHLWTHVYFVRSCQNFCYFYFIFILLNLPDIDNKKHLSDGNSEYGCHCITSCLNRYFINPEMKFFKGK